MLLTSIIVIVLFLWLLFNHPFKAEKTEDHYQHFLDRREEEKRKRGL